MTKLMNQKKTKRQKATPSYFAVKSHNEIYYQMASIFKQATDDEDTLAKKMLFKSIMNGSKNISLENSF